MAEKNAESKDITPIFTPVDLNSTPVFRPSDLASKKVSSPEEIGGANILRKSCVPSPSSDGGQAMRKQVGGSRRDLASLDPSFVSVKPRLTTNHRRDSGSNAVAQPMMMTEIPPSSSPRPARKARRKDQTPHGKTRRHSALAIKSHSLAKRKPAKSRSAHGKPSLKLGNGNSPSANTPRIQNVHGVHTPVPQLLPDPQLSLVPSDLKGVKDMSDSEPDTTVSKSPDAKSKSDLVPTASVTPLVPPEKSAPFASDQGVQKKSDSVAEGSASNSLDSHSHHPDSVSATAVTTPASPTKLTPSASGMPGSNPDMEEIKFQSGSENSGSDGSDSDTEDASDSQSTSSGSSLDLNLKTSSTKPAKFVPLRNNSVQKRHFGIVVLARRNEFGFITPARSYADERPSDIHFAWSSIQDGSISHIGRLALVSYIIGQKRNKRSALDVKAELSVPSGMPKPTLPGWVKSYDPTDSTGEIATKLGGDVFSLEFHLTDVLGPSRVSRKQLEALAAGEGSGHRLNCSFSVYFQASDEREQFLPSVSSISLSPTRASYNSDIITEPSGCFLTTHPDFCKILTEFGVNIICYGGGGTSNTASFSDKLITLSPASFDSWTRKAYRLQDTEEKYEGMPLLSIFLHSPPDLITQELTYEARTPLYAPEPTRGNFEHAIDLVQRAMVEQHGTPDRKIFLLTCLPDTFSAANAPLLYSHRILSKALFPNLRRITFFPNWWADTGSMAHGSWGAALQQGLQPALFEFTATERHSFLPAFSGNTSVIGSPPDLTEHEDLAASFVDTDLSGTKPPAYTGTEWIFQIPAQQSTHFSQCLAALHPFGVIRIPERRPAFIPKHHLYAVYFPSTELALQFIGSSWAPDPQQPNKQIVGLQAAPMSSLFAKERHPSVNGIVYSKKTNSATVRSLLHNLGSQWQFATGSAQVLFGYDPAKRGDSEPTLLSSLRMFNKSLFTRRNRGLALLRVFIAGAEGWSPVMESLDAITIPNPTSPPRWAVSNTRLMLGRFPARLNYLHLRAMESRFPEATGFAVVRSLHSCWLRIDLGSPELVQSTLDKWATHRPMRYGTHSVRLTRELGSEAPQLGATLCEKWSPGQAPADPPGPASPVSHKFKDLSHQLLLKMGGGQAKLLHSQAGSIVKVLKARNSEVPPHLSALLVSSVLPKKPSRPPSGAGTKPKTADAEVDSSDRARRPTPPRSEASLAVSTSNQLRISDMLPPPKLGSPPKSPSSTPTGLAQLPVTREVLVIDSDVEMETKNSGTPLDVGRASPSREGNLQTENPFQALAATGTEADMDIESASDASADTHPDDKTSDNKAIAQSVASGATPSDTPAPTKTPAESLPPAVSHTAPPPTKRRSRSRAFRTLPADSDLAAELCARGKSLEDTLASTKSVLAEAISHLRTAKVEAAQAESAAQAAERSARRSRSTQASRSDTAELEQALSRARSTHERGLAQLEEFNDQDLQSLVDALVKNQQSLSSSAAWQRVLDQSATLSQSFIAASRRLATAVDNVGNLSAILSQLDAEREDLLKRTPQNSQAEVASSSPLEILRKRITDHKKRFQSACEAQRQAEKDIDAINAQRLDLPFGDLLMDPAAAASELKKPVAARKAVVDEQLATVRAKLAKREHTFSNLRLLASKIRKLEAQLQVPELKATAQTARDFAKNCHLALKSAKLTVASLERKIRDLRADRADLILQLANSRNADTLTQTTHQAFATSYLSHTGNNGGQIPKSLSPDTEHGLTWRLKLESAPHFWLPDDIMTDAVQTIAAQLSAAGNKTIGVTPAQTKLRAGTPLTAFPPTDAACLLPLHLSDTHWGLGFIPATPVGDPLKVYIFDTLKPMTAKECKKRPTFLSAKVTRALQQLLRIRAAGKTITMIEASPARQPSAPQGGTGCCGQMAIALMAGIAAGLSPSALERYQIQLPGLGAWITSSLLQGSFDWTSCPKKELDPGTVKKHRQLWRRSRPIMALTVAPSGLGQAEVLHGLGPAPAPPPSSTSDSVQATSIPLTPQ